MFEYELNSPVDTAKLEELFSGTGWAEPDSARKLDWVVASSEEWISCYLEGELVGFGRTFRLDSIWRLVFDVVVDERFQGWGLDHEIVRRLTEGAPRAERIEVFRQKDLGQDNSHPGVSERWGQRVPDCPPGTYLG